MKSAPIKKSAKAARKQPARQIAPARREPPRLIIAASEDERRHALRDALLRARRVLCFSQHGRTTILLSDLEVDRGRKQATVDEVLSLSEFTKEHKKALGAQAGVGEGRRAFPARSRRVRRAVVPESFPLGLRHGAGAEGRA